MQGRPTKGLAETRLTHTEESTVVEWRPFDGVEKGASKGVEGGPKNGRGRGGEGKAEMYI